MKDFMMLMDKGIDSKEASLSGMDLNAPKKRSLLCTPV